MGDDGGIAINVAQLLTRLQKLHDQFTGNPELYNGATALQLAHGKRVEGVEDPMVVVMQQHLFGYEFPDTIGLLVRGTLYLHASAKKLSYLEPAKAQAAGGPVKIELIVREKGDQSVPANAAAFTTLIEAVNSSAANGQAAKLATFPGDKEEGTVVPAWRSSLLEARIDSVDGIRGIEAYLAVKDSASMADMKQAGVLAARCLKYVLVDDMEKAIDKDRKLSNLKLAEQAEAVMQEKTQLATRKVNVDTENFEVAMKPSVQSGGEYNVFIHGNVANNAPPASSGKGPLSYDVIMTHLGMRYGSQRAIVGRTYLIDASPNMVAHYDALLDAHNCLIAALKPGRTIKEAVDEAKAVLMNAQGLNPNARLNATMGCGIGARLQDKFLALSSKNTTVIEPGMSFLVTLGLRDIPMDDKHPVADAAVNKLQAYSLMLADTVMVEASGPVCVTDKAPRDRKNIAYEMAGDEEEEEEEEEDDKKQGSKAAGDRPRRSTVIVDDSKGRDATGRSARLKEKAQTVDPDAVRKREEAQAQLVLARKEKAQRKKNGETDADDEDKDADQNEVARAPDIVALPSVNELPRARATQITVDKAHDCILVPILGQLVPFHISTIKTISKTEEGKKAFLRLQFYGPTGTGSIGKDVPPSMAKALMAHPNLAYVKSLNFVSRDHKNFVGVEQLVKAMLKKFRADRKEESERAGLVAQDKLVVSRDDKIPRMNDVNMWPAASGRKSQGSLAAHTNGLRFTGTKGGDPPIDIIYSNIKVPIFQPCEGEHIALIHFHLKNPILIGKKKYKDVQFYTEVVESSEALNQKRGYNEDPDELEEEQRSEQLKSKLNDAFRKFVRRVEELAGKSGTVSNNFSFEIPERDLQFQGALKEMTTIQPCISSLFAVVDKPPMVAPVPDIELVHFERIAQGGKSFDMVIVLKKGVADKGTEPWIRITSIEMKHLEQIKTWLTEVAEIPYSESLESLSWKQLLDEQVYRDDFWLTTDEETGGKKYPGIIGVLNPLGEDEDGEGMEEDEESEEYSEDEESEEEDDDEDFDSAVEDEDEDEESDYDEDEDDEEGEDWDELERKAEEDDKKRRRHDDDDDDDRGKKAKRSRR